MEFGLNDIFMRLRSLVFFSLCCAGAWAHAEAVDLDPTEDKVKVLTFEKPGQSLDKLAPPSQFTHADGEAAWNEACGRVSKQDSSHTGGAFDFTLVPDDFRAATNFYNERYNPGDSSDSLSVIVSAAEAVRDGKFLLLKQMRMIYFISDTPPAAESASGINTTPGAPFQVGRKNQKTPAVSMAGMPGTKGKKDAAQIADAPLGGMSIPGGGRLVILAPKCRINLETNVGFAEGGASIEIFPKPEDGKELKHVALLQSPFINWRSWSEAATGSTEVAMYTCGDNENREEPEVYFEYVNRMPDGSESTVKIRGRGMIFENGKFDHLTARADEDDRTVGLSLVERSKATFHKDISTEMTASTVKSLMPFQGAAPATPPAGKKTGDSAALKPRKIPAPEPEPEVTVITCDGPAVFDMAYVSRKTYDPVAEVSGNAEAVEVDLPEILMGKRYEFLNRVKLVKKPIAVKPAPPGAPDMATHMDCRHLRIQYPAGAVPGAASIPEYTEAIGGVKMSGYKPPPPPDPNLPPQPPQAPTPFSISSERMYMDGPNDNMFLVGTTESPAWVIDTAGMAQAQQFCFRRATQTMTMPNKGPKRLVIRPTAMAIVKAPVDPAAPVQPPSPNPAPDAAAKPPQTGVMGGGDTIISWTGPLYREIHHLPMPGRRDVIKEILTLNNSVVIEQKESGLVMKGERIRLYRDLEKNQVDFIDATGDVEIEMGLEDRLKAVGHIVTVEMAFNDKGEEIKNIVTVIGNRKTGKKADVYKGGGSAVRSDKFIIDRVADNFIAFGGTVAVVKSETPPAPPAQTEPKPEAALGAGGLMGSINFQSGGNIFIQCDGEFVQSGVAHTVTADGNVLIRQPGLTLLANNVLITLGDAAPPPANLTYPPVPGAAAAPAAALFSGDLKAIECYGMVEMITDDKLIHADIMKFEAAEEKTILDMLDAEDDVRVYMHGDDGNDKVMCARHNLLLEQKTGTFTPGGQMLILPYHKSQPAPRGAANSPSRKMGP